MPSLSKLALHYDVFYNLFIFLFFKIQLAPPDEPEITIVEENEYFVVGGIYHFDLFNLPSPTVKAGCWIFTHCKSYMNL